MFQCHTKWVVLFFNAKNNKNMWMKTVNCEGPHTAKKGQQNGMFKDTFLNLREQ